MKSCTKCKRSDVLFGKSSKTRDGLKSHCKLCCKDYRSKTKDRQKEYMAGYYVRNKEYFQEHHADYYEAHKEHLNEYNRSYWRQSIQENPAKHIFQRVRSRAMVKGIPFDLGPDDVQIPEFCPVLGIKIVCVGGRPRPDSPSLDRKIPSLGYVKGNVRVISNRANTLKSDATASEMELVLADLRQLSC